MFNSDHPNRHDRARADWIKRLSAVMLLPFLAPLTFAQNQIDPPDAHDLPRLDWPTMVASAMNSSVCPDGSRYDRQGPTMDRILRREGDEAVLFEANGSGVLTRMWMTTGKKVAHPLPSRLVLLIRIDGQLLMEQELDAFFAGEHSLFTQPGVLDLMHSGGGNVCHIPIAYAKSCKISIRGLNQELLWFQFHHVTLPSDTEIPNSSRRTGFTHLSKSWARWLGRAGKSPWPTGTWLQGDPISLNRPSQRCLYFKGSGQLEGLTIMVEPELMDQLILTVISDGRQRVNLPLTSIFGNRSLRQATRDSLMAGSGAKSVTLHWPMPFRKAIDIRLTWKNGMPTDPHPIRLAYRLSNQKPHAAAGYFTAIPFTIQSQPGEPLKVFDQMGLGKWVGLRMTLSDPSGAGLDILEGDEFLLIDDSKRASHQGTGVEDFFGGGFFFREPASNSQNPHPFQTALHGLESFIDDNGTTQLTMNRTLVADAVPFKQRLRMILEGGPTGKLPLKAEGIAYFYMADSEVEQKMAQPIQR